jgi:hypothetical protein
MFLVCLFECNIFCYLCGCTHLDFVRSVFTGNSYLNYVSILYLGVARDVNFIPTARVPVLQYVSNHFGISCDISIDNYPGRIKSKVLYWINTLDGRFGDMVLLVSSSYPRDSFLSDNFLVQLKLSTIFSCRSRNGQKLKTSTIQKMEPSTPIRFAYLCSFIFRCPFQFRGHLFFYQQFYQS